MPIPAQVDISVVGPANIDLVKLRRYMRRFQEVVTVGVMAQIQVIPPPINGKSYQQGELSNCVDIGGESEYHVIIVSRELLGNYFAWFYDESKEILLTTYESDFICKIVDIDLELGVSHAILEGVVVKTYGEKTGNPYDIFVDPPEGAPFDFCSNKLDMRFQLENPVITPRVEYKLQQASFSEENIARIRRAFPKSRKTAYDSIGRMIRLKWQDISIGVVLGAAFCAIGFVLSQ